MNQNFKKPSRQSVGILSLDRYCVPPFRGVKINTMKEKDNYVFAFSEKNIDKPSWFESFCLLFCKKHYSCDEITGIILVAKFFRKRIYVIKEIKPK